MPSLAVNLALLDFLDAGTIWILVPMMIFSIPIIGILVGPLNAHIKSSEREKLRKMYERLAMEKLDVIKTAVAMGFQRADLQELDERLEAAIGSEEMKALLAIKSGEGGGKGAKVQINIGKRNERDTATIDVDDLLAGELGETLRQRRSERDRNRD